MTYNELSPEEERVIVNKATSLLFLVNMTIFTKKEHMFVEDVIYLSFPQKASLIPAVDGQVLMIIIHMQ